VHETVETPPRPTRAFEFVDRHLALLGALAVVVLASLRVYFVAGFHLPTALTVLSVVDRTQLLTSTVLAALTTAVPSLLAFFWVEVRRWVSAGLDDQAERWRRVAIGAVILPFFGILTITVPVVLLLAVGAAVLLRLISQWRARRRARRSTASPEERQRRTEARIQRLISIREFIAVSFLGLLLFQVFTAPWLPKESVELQGNGERTVGYLVGAQGEMTLLLEAPHGQPVWIQTSAIEARDTCKSQRHWLVESLGDLGIRGQYGEEC
jgi:hypothetical protein